MTRETYITTSWDDGHPLDLRVADLLTKYGLTGTFYVPKTAEHGTMTESEMRTLSPAFELGAHTLGHVDLTGATEQVGWKEIFGSKTWLEDETGESCSMFCPPKGKYHARHLDLIRRAGYTGVRTSEPLSIDFPDTQSGLAVMPTTVHAYSHTRVSTFTYLLRWAAFKNVWFFIVHGRSRDWTRLAESLLAYAIQHGGVFHLWGHSWELEHADQWQRLEEVFRMMEQFTSQAPTLTNGQICQAITGTASTDKPAANLALVER